MNNKTQILKQLANTLVDTGSINPSVSKYILNKLTKREQRTFLHYLRTSRDRRTVTIFSSSHLSDDLQIQLTNKFNGKHVDFEIDESLGGGLVIKDNDIITNLSVKNYIDRTITKLIE